MSQPGAGFDIYAHLQARPSPHMHCPHCNGVGGASPNPELVFACNLCGAPRIMMPDGMPVEPATLGLLQKADRARKKRGFLAGLGVVGAVGAAFGLLVTLITFFISVGWSLLPALLFVAPSILAIVFARGARGAATKEIASSIDAAWISAAGDLVRAGKIKSAADLSRVTGVDPGRAQQVFTMLTVDADLGASHVRIDAGPVVAQVPVDPRFAALEERERQAEAEASAALDARAKGRSG
ncbi:MAG: hypothetical protein IPM79_08550 [Polyangiaceae bacterium]|nr:hypothetical protein [Polyangiaceae bacterium]MBK8937679.1 hypothetical protein [Polyangiaceae bacterium]